MRRTVSILAIGLLISFNALAVANSRISLKFNFSRFGKSICHEVQVVKEGDLNLLCEGMRGDTRVLLKVSAEKRRVGTVLISATIEEIDSSGVVTIVSNPSIQALFGEEAEISHYDDSGELLAFGVLANLEQ